MSEGVYWVDANVLLRFLIGEPPKLAERDERILERAEGGELTLRVHPVVVAETVWVLRFFYERTAEEIAGALVPLFSGNRLRAEDGRVIVAALEAMAREGADFADALLAEKVRSQEEGVAAFDRDFDAWCGSKQLLTRLQLHVAHIKSWFDVPTAIRILTRSW